MKKTVKDIDIRKMVKTYNLSDDEKFQLEEIVYDINHERHLNKYGTQLSFLLSPMCSFLTVDKYNAVAALLMYYGLKIQEEVGYFFDETSEALGNLLNCNPDWIKRIFRGMSFGNPRWQRKMYLADRCGLNTLELYKEDKIV